MRQEHCTSPVQLIECDGASSANVKALPEETTITMPTEVVEGLQELGPLQRHGTARTEAASPSPDQGAVLALEKMQKIRKCSLHGQTLGPAFVGMDAFDGMGYTLCLRS